MSGRFMSVRGWALLVCVLALAMLLGCGGGTNRFVLTIDNLDVSCAIISGDWGQGGPHDGNGCWGPDFLYLYADPTNVGRVRFHTDDVGTRADYDIYIWWSADSDRTQHQPVIVHDANGADTTYHVDLQQHGHQWFLLGTHDMGPAGCYIEFNNDTEPSSHGSYCNADAVRLVRR